MSPAVQDIFADWSLPIWLTLSIVVTGVIYLRGWVIIRRTRPDQFTWIRPASFLGGLIVLWLAIGSPMDGFADALLSAHMIEHLLLMSVVPPLLLVGLPAVPLLRGLPLGLRRFTVNPLLRSPAVQRTVHFISTPLIAWLTAISGAFIAPVVEEIAFRGFLLPSIAIAYDWICLERTPAAYNRWRQTTSNTTPALVLAAVVSSAAFAALHGFQLHWAFGVIAGLFVVSLVLSAVRIHFKSVAASTLVHVSYNFLLLLQMVIVTHGFRHLDKLTQ